MIPLPHTITVTVPTLVKDRYNNDVLTYDPATGQTMSAFVQPDQGAENTVARDAVEYAYTVFTTEDIDARARVTWEGRTFEVSGPARPWSTPYGLHHFETYLRVVEG